MARTLFVSDIHLRPRSPENNRPFFEFLRQPCDAMYLVGDVFDYWIGPRHLKIADYREELAALRRKAAECAAFFIHGNRDYLVDEKFARATGIRVLGDRARLELGGRTVLLAHGDFIYNKNPKYTAYRTMMKSKPLADLWRAVPSAVGTRLVRGFRKVSTRTTPGVDWKPEEMVGRARSFFERGADVLICGHIHQPQHHVLQVGARRCDLYVLGDWCGGTRDYVEHDGTAFHFKRWPKS